MKLTPEETKLEGHWLMENGKMISDNVTKRIESLIANDLKKINIDISGWQSLYLDTNDNRYWELTYLQSFLQGGGPPTLQHISREQAQRKYLI